MNVRLIAIGVAACAAAAGASGQTLGQGLTLDAFKQTFAQGAKADGEKEAALQGCKDTRTTDGKAIAYSCGIGGRGFVAGVMAPDRQLRDVSVTYAAGDRQDVYLFQRSVKYAVAAATGMQARNGVALAADLMGKAASQKGKPASKDENGFRYTALLQPSASAPDVSSWVFSITRL